MKRKLQYSNINQNMKCDNKVIKVSNPGTWETWDLGPTKDHFTFYILYFAKPGTLLDVRPCHLVSQSIKVVLNVWRYNV